MTSIFDCCDSCDALLTDAEKTAGVRYGQTLCDSCAAQYALVNPPRNVQEVLQRHADSHRRLAGSDAYSAQEAPRLQAAVEAIAQLVEVAGAAQKKLHGHEDPALRSLGRELSVALAKFEPQADAAGGGAPSPSVYVGYLLNTVRLIEARLSRSASTATELRDMRADCQSYARKAIDNFGGLA